MAPAIPDTDYDWRPGTGTVPGPLRRLRGQNCLRIIVRVVLGGATLVLLLLERMSLKTMI